MRVTTIATAASLVLAGPAAAGTYGFTQHDILARQSSLQYELAQIHSLAGLPGQVIVRCRGEQHVALGDASSGYARIRCTTSVSQKDYLFSRNASGRIELRYVASGSGR